MQVYIRMKLESIAWHYPFCSPVAVGGAWSGRPGRCPGWRVSRPLQRRNVSRWAELRLRLLCDGPGFHTHEELRPSSNSRGRVGQRGVPQRAGLDRRSHTERGLLILSLCMLVTLPLGVLYHGRCATILPTPTSTSRSKQAACSCSMPDGSNKRTSVNVPIVKRYCSQCLGTEKFRGTGFPLKLLAIGLYI